MLSYRQQNHFSPNRPLGTDVIFKKMVSPKKTGIKKLPIWAQITTVQAEKFP
jgi:hypothetical protein